MIIIHDMMSVTMAAVCLLTAVPGAGCLIAYRHALRTAARLKRMTAEVTDPAETERLDRLLSDRRLPVMISRARRRMTGAAAWSLVIPLVWYLLAPDAFLRTGAYMPAITLGGSALMMIITLMTRLVLRVRMRGLPSGDVRLAMKSYTVRQLLTMAAGAVLGAAMFV